MKWNKLQKILKSKRLSVFTIQDIKRLRGGSFYTNRRLLERYTKMGFILRLKKGLYALADPKPPSLLIANKLYQPSYISFDFALSYHHIIPETVYTITSATTKPTRRFNSPPGMFTYQTIRKSAYQGYEPKKVDGHTILLATPEKALADTLYFIFLQKRGSLDRLDLKKINRRTLIRYLNLFGKRKLVEMGRNLF